MIIIIDTDDPEAEQWYEQIIEDGQIGYRCSVECEGRPLKYTTAKAWPGHPEVRVGQV